MARCRPLVLVRSSFRRPLSSGASAVPLVDISSLRDVTSAPQSRHSAAAAIHAAFRSSGFLYLSGHGVDPRLLGAVRDAAAAFFAQSDVRKQLIRLTERSACRGYQPLRMNVTQGVGDLHEGLDWYAEEDDASRVPEELRGPNQWPEDVPGLRAALRKVPDRYALSPDASFRQLYDVYFREMLGLGRDVMRGVALGLGRPEDHFAPFYERSYWCARALHYPLQEELHDAGHDQGVGEHSDYGCLTLITADAAPGFDECLEIRQEGSGEWVLVPNVEGAFVVNIGDMLAHWVQGYKSTRHRVRSPRRHRDMTPDEVARGRISMAFFFEPNLDAVVRPLDGTAAEHVIFGEHLRQKVAGNFRYA